MGPLEKVARKKPQRVRGVDLLDTVLEEILSVESSVGVVAVDTEDPAFLEGMMAWQGKLDLDGMMAAETKLARSKRGDF